MSEISTKVSTTQVASGLAILLTVYNMFAQNSNLQTVTATPEELLAIATLGAPIIPSLYVMWRRTKKSLLKYGFLK